MAESQKTWRSKARTSSPISRWTGFAFHGLAAAILLVLAAACGISDRHWLGAAWGIWPTWFWAPGVVLLVALGHRGGQARATAALLAATAVICVVFSEGWLIFRRENPVERHVFREAHRRLSEEPNGADALSRRGLPLRVVSWNVNGLSGGADRILAHLAGREPDICFLQEIWGGENELPRPTIDRHLPGYGWFAEPDCGLLSRYPATVGEPIELLDGRAQVVEINLPASQTLTCINVHLPLLPLRLAVHRGSVRDETRRAVQDRSTTMKRLVAAVRIHSTRGPVIVAGDWNVPATAGSLRPLRKLLGDAFRSGGSGWGNTMTAAFPVSRIDAIFVSSGCGVSYCRAHRADLSDHRVVEAELWLPPGR